MIFSTPKEAVYVLLGCFHNFLLDPYYEPLNSRAITVVQVCDKPSTLK